MACTTRSWWSGTSPATAVESTLARLEQLTVAVARPDGTTQLFCESAQVTVSAAWASSATMQCPVTNGLALFGIGRTGVSTWTARVAAGGVELTGAMSSPVEPELLLIANRRPTQPDARVRPSPLIAVAHAPALAAYVADHARHPLAPVGEIRGAFGHGIDQIVVYQPKRPNDHRAREFGDMAACAALLVASGTPRGFMPLSGAENRPAEEEGMLLTGVGVAGITDIDGDGIDEVLWVSQRWGGDDSLLHSVEASYHADDGFHLHTLVSQSYGGFEPFLHTTDAQPRRP